MLRKILVAAAVMLTSVSAFAIERGDKSVGIRAGYTTSNRSAVAGLYFQYAFSSRFRIAPDVDYSFRNRGQDAFSINLNGHFPITAPSNRLTVYPLAGLNYTTWNFHDDRTETRSNDVSTRTDRLGLNVGAGADYMMTPTLKLGAEAKFRWTRDYNSGVFTVSIGYLF